MVPAWQEGQTGLPAGAKGLYWPAMATLDEAQTDRVARFVLGGLLLLPALLVYGLTVWCPTLHTLALSLQTAAPARAAPFSGLANYLGLAQDPGLGPALAHGGLVALVRLVAVLPLPGLCGWLWARQGARWRLVTRLGLGLALALSAPASLGLLWRLAAERLPWLRSLCLAGGSPSLGWYLALEFLAFLGLGGALATTAYLSAWRRPQPAAVRLGLLGLVGLLAVASGLDSFSLAYVTTGGGPHYRTVTLPLHAFLTAFAELRQARAAALATLLLGPCLGLGLAFGLGSQALGLRLVPAQPAAPAPARRWALPAGLCALAAIVAPGLFLYLWGAGLALAPLGSPLAQASATLAVGLSLLNGALVPALALAGVQLPVAYLAAASLELVRPLGRVGSRAAFVLLLASGFVPGVAVAIGAHDALRGLGLLNTPPAAALAWLAGPASLYLFHLYFAGQRPAIEKARRAGQPSATAFIQLALRPSLPIGLLAGAVSLLLGGQSLLWPLLALAQSDYYPLSLRLAVFQTPLADQGALGAAAWLALSVWAGGMLLLWWPLQTLVLERWELVAEAATPHSP